MPKARASESVTYRCCSAAAPIARSGGVARMRWNPARANLSDRLAIKRSRVPASCSGGIGVRIIGSRADLLSRWAGFADPHHLSRRKEAAHRAASLQPQILAIVSVAPGGRRGKLRVDRRYNA